MVTVDEILHNFLGRLTRVMRDPSDEELLKNANKLYETLPATITVEHLERAAEDILATAKAKSVPAYALLRDRIVKASRETKFSPKAGATKVTPETYVDMALAHMRLHAANGVMGFMISRGTEEWRAWETYLSARLIPHAAMRGSDRYMVPAQWPTDFDTDALRDRPTSTATAITGPIADKANELLAIWRPTAEHITDPQERRRSLVEFLTYKGYAQGVADLKQRAAA